MDIMNDLNKLQTIKETLLSSYAGSEKGRQYFEAIRKEQEYNLKHGKEAISEILPIVENTVAGMYGRKNMHRKKFYWEVVKPAQIKYREELENKVPKAKRSINPDEKIAEIVGIVLAGSLSKQVLFTSVVMKMANFAFSMFGVPFHQREELKAPAVNFFVPLIQEVAELTDIFFLEQPEGRETYLTLSPQWVQHIQEVKGNFNLDVGAFHPMIVKPTRHTSLVDDKGGYLTIKSPLLKYPVKEGGKIHPMLLNFTDKTNPVYFEIINAAQEVPYCVNVKLLNVLQQLNENGLSFKDFPIEPNNEVAHKIAEEKVAYRNHRRAEFAKAKGEEYIPLKQKTVDAVFHNEENAEKEKADRVCRTLEQAEDFAYFEAFYYPLFVDYRGRRYPYANTGLSYQGDELGKALVQFANKKKVTHKGVFALFDTLANTLGFDKLTLEVKRAKAISFYEENKEAWMAGDFSMFPLDSHSDNPVFDEPINALAIVLELLEIEKDPEYKCGYIAHRDARCSGSSIMGTVLRDKSLMEMTSVIDWSEEGKLGDAYNSVARIATKYTETVAEKGDELAQELLEYRDVLFSRSAFKFPVLGIGYGVTEFGKREHTATLLNWEKELSFKHKQLYDNIMLESLKRALPACNTVLEAIKEAAKGVMENSDVISFHNPITGFPVVHKEFVQSVRELDINSGWRRIQVSLITHTKKVNSRGMINASSPNLVHSCDSALLSVVEGLCEHDIACIHDSIGSHPEDVETTVQAYAKAMSMLSDVNVFNLIFESMGSDVRIEKMNTFEGVLQPSRHVLV